MAEPSYAHNRFELRYGLVSRQGGRELNEDSCAVRDYSIRRRPKYACFMAMADGMGGHQAGDVASEVAVHMLEEMVGPQRFEDKQDFSENVERVLWSAFSTINSHIYDLGRTSPERKGMGTTLTCALVDDTYAHVGHVGDTRAYIISSGGISQITEDHSVVGKMLSDGVLTEREAQTHSERNILTRAIGPQQNVEIDILKVPVHPGEIVFMCCDGLYTAVSNAEILEVLLTEGNLQTACERLADLAIARGSDDNVSAAAWRMPLEETLAAGASSRKAARKKMRGKGLSWRAVALLAVLMLIIGFGVGWGIGSLLHLERGAEKETETTTKGGAEKPETSAASETKQEAGTFVKGSTVKIAMASSAEPYHLRSEASKASHVVVDVPNGCRLEVLSKEPVTDNVGNQWYYVKVIDSVPQKGNMGYAMSKYLVKP